MCYSIPFKSSWLIKKYSSFELVWHRKKANLKHSTVLDFGDFGKIVAINIPTNLYYYYSTSDHPETKCGQQKLNYLGAGLAAGASAKVANDDILKAWIFESCFDINEILCFKEISTSATFT